MFLAVFCINSRRNINAEYSRDAGTTLYPRCLWHNPFRLRLFLYLLSHDTQNKIISAVFTLIALTFFILGLNTHTHLLILRVSHQKNYTYMSWHFVFSQQLYIYYCQSISSTLCSLLKWFYFPCFSMQKNLFEARIDHNMYIVLYKNKYIYLIASYSSLDLIYCEHRCLIIIIRVWTHNTRISTCLFVYLYGCMYVCIMDDRPHWVSIAQISKIEQWDPIRAAFLSHRVFTLRNVCLPACLSDDRVSLLSMLYQLVFGAWFSIDSVLTLDQTPSVWKFWNYRLIFHTHWFLIRFSVD